jgi:hypothetical protein
VNIVYKLFLKIKELNLTRSHEHWKSRVRNNYLGSGEKKLKATLWPDIYTTQSKRAPRKDGGTPAPNRVRKSRQGKTILFGGYTKSSSLA